MVAEDSRGKNWQRMSELRQRKGVDKSEGKGEGKREPADDVQKAAAVAKVLNAMRALRCTILTWHMVIPGERRGPCQCQNLNQW